MSVLSRRRFLGLLGAPAIVRASSLMPIMVPRKSYLQTVIDEYGVPSFLETSTDPNILDILRGYSLTRLPVFDGRAPNPWSGVPEETDAEFRGRIMNHGNATNYELLEPQ